MCQRRRNHKKEGLRTEDQAQGPKVATNSPRNIFRKKASCESRAASPSVNVVGNLLEAKKGLKKGAFEM